MNNITFLNKGKLPDRSKTIGASDISTLALLNLKYNSTPLTLYNEKIGLSSSFNGNERTYSGHMLEPIAIARGLQKLEYLKSENEINKFLSDRYLLKKKHKTLLSFTESKCESHPYIVAHADIIESESPFIIEAKTAGLFGTLRKNDIDYGYNKEDFSANGIPSSVYLQIQCQMMCYKIKKSYVSLISDTGLHYLYGPIHQNIEIQNKILALAEKFKWHLDNRKPPKPETWDDVIYLNPDLDKENKTVVGGETAEKVKEMKDRAVELRIKAKKIDKEMKDIKNAIGLIIGGNATLEDAEGKGLATAFDVTKYFLKDYKNMDEELFNKLVNDGFITESKYRDMRY